MATRRVVIGRQSDGSYGLRSSVTGYDALAADGNDSDKLSFNSDWTNLLKIHAVGIASTGVRQYLGTSPAIIPFPALSYVPFAEARSMSGDVVFDDFLIPHGLTGGGSTTSTNLLVSVTSNHLKVTRNQAGVNILYAIYRESV